MLKNRKVALIVAGLLVASLLAAQPSGAVVQKEGVTPRLSQGRITALADASAPMEQAVAMIAVVSAATAKASVGALMGMGVLGPLGSAAGALTAGLASLKHDLFDFRHISTQVAQTLGGGAQGAAAFPVRLAATSAH